MTESALDSSSTTRFANEIWADPTPLLAGGAGGDETLFASASAMGLGFGDDIDAVSIFDTDNSSDFSSGDQVFFSLTPGSTLLGAMGWSAADVLTISFGDNAPSVFATASDLGLAFNDNLNMLELVPLGVNAEQTIGSKVPAPGSVALLGFVGALGCTRRRR